MRLMIALLALLCCFAAAQAADIKPAPPAGPAIAVVPPKPAPGGMVKIGPILLPEAPARPGCFKHVPNAATWVEIPCAPPEAAQHIPHGENGVTIIQSVQPGQPAGPKALGGEVDVQMVQLGSVTDSSAGANHFSIQLNPGFFPGPNGDTYAVQFLYQAFVYNGQTYTVLDIQQNDATKQIYPTPAHPTVLQPTRAAKTGDVATLSASASGGNLQFYSVIPWATTAGAAGADSFLTVEPDNDGFASANPWNSVNGGILGAGNSSKATFTQSCVTTTVKTWFNPIPAPLPTEVALPPPGLPGGTQESNNLTEVNALFVTWSEGTASGAFHGVSQDWLTAGLAKCYPGDVPPGKLTSGSSPVQVQESDPPSSASNPAATVRLCPQNAFVIGVDAQHSRLLCSTAMPAATTIVPDTGVTKSFTIGKQAYTYHVCPPDSGMIGWLQQSNALVCGALPASGYIPQPKFGQYQVNQSGDTEVPEPNHKGTNMHGCDASGQGTPLVVVGVDTATNVLVCMNADELPRLQ